jgi:hypothetical protein
MGREGDETRGVNMGAGGWDERGRGGILKGWDGRGHCSNAGGTFWIESSKG